MNKRTVPFSGLQKECTAMGKVVVALSGGITSVLLTLGCDQDVALRQSTPGCPSVSVSLCLGEYESSPLSVQLTQSDKLGAEYCRAFTDLVFLDKDLTDIGNRRLVVSVKYCGTGKIQLDGRLLFGLFGARVFDEEFREVALAPPTWRDLEPKDAVILCAGEETRLAFNLGSHTANRLDGRKYYVTWGYRSTWIEYPEESTFWRGEVGSNRLILVKRVEDKGE